MSTEKPKRMGLANAQQALKVLRRLDPPTLLQTRHTWSKHPYTYAVAFPEVECVECRQRTMAIRIYGFKFYISYENILAHGDDRKGPNDLKPGWVGPMTVSTYWAKANDLIDLDVPNR